MLRGALSLYMQTFCCAAWLTTTLVISLSAIPKLDQEGLDVLYVFFQPFCPCLLMLWLWTLNVRHFESVPINYKVCFAPPERRFLLPFAKLIKVAAILTGIALTGACTCAWLCVRHVHAATGWIPLATYMAVGGFLVMPLRFMHRGSRMYFATTFQRVLVPVREVTWADFLLADVMTSLAKSSMDFERATCLMLSGKNVVHLRGQAADLTSSSSGSVCGPLAWHSITALCAPYFIRLLQCLQIFYTAGVVPQLFNALKYLTAIPALILTVQEHEYHVHHVAFPFWSLWLVSQTLNSLYSFYWDVEMDWDMPWFLESGQRRHWRKMVRLPSLRSNTLYPRRWYYVAALINLVLRFSWMHRLFGELEANNLVVFIVTVLEVLRRFQWLYIRIETELRKIRALSLDVPLVDFDQHESDPE